MNLIYINMENFSLLELYGIKKRLIQENYGDVELMDLVLETIKNKEELLLETSATGGPSAGGMGAVVSAQPGALPGQTGTTGSGDVSFTFKKEKRKKGGPSQVSDLRDLKDVKTDKVEDIKESYNLTEDESLLIDDCIIELIDMGFEINKVNADSEDQEYDIDDDTQGNFKSQEIRISLFKQVEKLWRGNLQLRYSFDKNEVYKKNISTLRPNRDLEDYESKIVDIAEEASYKLINHLEYTSGELMVEFLVAGSAMPYDKLRHVNINVHIILNRNIYPTNESYNDIQEYTSQITNHFKSYNIRPIVLNHILDQCQDQISEYYEEGKDPKFFVDEIVKDMELDSGGFMAHKVGSAGYSKVIKYL